MIVFVNNIVSNQLNGDVDVDPFETMPFFFGGIVLVGLIAMGTLLGWMYSVAMGLQSKVPDGVKLNVKRFKIFFWTPVVYFGLIILFILAIANENPPHPAIFAFIVPMHLFSVFCMFYIINFVAKTIKTVELQRQVTFSDFVAEFFLMWFYIIGIWILQPRVNRFHRGEIDALGHDPDDVI